MRMTIRAALKRAFSTYKAQLPDMLRYALLTLIIHGMPLAPALALLDRKLYPICMLCAVLFVALVLPMRLNTADRLQRALRGERIFDLSLVSCRDYGRKVMSGLIRTLLLLLWALPALAATVWAYRLYAGDGVHGQNDAVTLLLQVKNQFGGGDIIHGIVNLVLLYLALWLPLAIGCGFHSGARHAEALGQKKLLRGHRLGQLLAWVCAQLTLLPWLIAVCIPIIHYVPELTQAVKRFTFDTMASPVPTLLWIAGLTCVLLLPVLPLRDLIIAAYPASLAEEARRDA